jgi:phosphatidylglycerophosphate synthase
MLLMFEILTALILAFAVVWVLIVQGGEDSRGNSRWGAWPVFLLMILAVLAGGVWLTPVGPPLMGVHWVPILFVAIFIALFRAAAAAPARRRRRRGAPQFVAMMPEETADTPVGLGVLFWLLLIGLAMAAIVQYTLAGRTVLQAS